LCARAVAQLQKFEDSAPDSLEFERLKEHFEPFLRASSSSSSAGLPGHSHATHSHTPHVNPITAAASSALARDIPGVEKYTPTPRGRRDKGARDELATYRSRVEVAGTKDAANVDFMRRLEQVTQVAALNQRWASSWMTTLRSRYVFQVGVVVRAYRAQRSQAITNSSAFQKDEALSDVSSYSHQTRAEATIGPFQNQTRRGQLLARHDGLLSSEPRRSIWETGSGQSSGCRRGHE
jgi:hypothetical protein